MVDPNESRARENFTTHKDRAEWFSQRVSYPLRDADPCNLEAFYAEERKKPKPAEDWKCMGPFNVGGRVTALVAHPADSNILYAGTAGGGVWQTDSGGRKWTTNWPQWFTSSIGSLAIHPLNSDVIYCGTGEASFSADDYPGSGVFISRNAGKTWKALADSGRCRIPRRIGVIAIDPRDPSGKRLYLGGISHDDTMASGLFCSQDGGLKWDHDDFVSAQNYDCNSIAFHPSGILYTTVLARGPRSGIWRLSSLGWEHLTRGLPSSELLGRISLAIGLKKPFPIYALIGNRFGKAFLGIYRSLNMGDKWTRLDDGGLLKDEDQASYNNTIAVSPVDPKLVVCGANNVLLSRDGGNSWTRPSYWKPRGVPTYVHSDQHAFVLSGEPFPRRIYAGNDGGVFVTENLGASWEPRNQDLATTLFYSVAVAPTDSRIIGGGTQDNGTLLTGLRPDAEFGDFDTVQAGDGAWMVVDPVMHTHIFASNTEFRIRRHSSEGKWEEALPQGMSEDERKQVPIARMAIHPERNPGLKTLWTGSRRLWHTSNSGGLWNPSSPFFDGSAITAIDVAAVKKGRILVGTARGGIYRSTDGGKTWSGDLAGPEIPKRLISDFETHPRKPNTIIAVVAGSGMLTRARSTVPDLPQLQHIFFSEDGGKNWQGIASVGVPDMACYSAVWETRPPYRLFFSTDCGVWSVPSDFGVITDWTRNLPTVRIPMLVYHERDRVLTAATYGRGIWRIPVPKPSPDRQGAV